MPDPNVFKNQIVWFNTDMVPEFKADWFTDDYWQQQNAVTGQATGRGITTFFDYLGKSFVLRHYRRGGLPGKFLTDQFWYSGLANTRAWRELNLLLQLRELNLPVPAPVAARVKKSGLVYRSDIVLEKIPDAQDVHTVLLKQNLREETWQNIGKTIALFHRFQVFHHDLNIHNVMLDKDNKVWLIDFDKCGIKKGDKWKNKNIERLFRSLNKEKQAAEQYHFDHRCWELLLKGYHNK